MKRFLIAVAAIILGCTAASALVKGDKYFGGNLGFTISTSSSVGVAIQPEFGYFGANNWKIGVDASYTYQGIHAFTLMPNFAYYVNLCDGLYYTPGISLGLALYAGGGVALGFASTLNLFSLEFRPTPRFGFTANIVSFKLGVAEGGGVALGGHLGVNPTVGFKYYF